MLLQALYAYAQRQQLFDNLPLLKKNIHVLIAIDNQGNLREQTLIPLMQPDAKGKERIGQERLMPRFPGENNGGKSYFLAENSIAVLGADKLTGLPIPVSLNDRSDATTTLLSAWKKMKLKNVGPRKVQLCTSAFNNFWGQIQDAYSATRDLRLKAILDFRSKYIKEDNGKIWAKLPFIKTENNKNGEPELFGNVGQKKPVLMKKLTIAFSVAGEPLTLDSDDEPLKQYWFQKYVELAFGDDEDEKEEQKGDYGAIPTICLVTGEVGQPIARSHKPKIKLPSGNGYIVSFAKEAPAFSSYGFEMGQNAPISEKVAASYALALNKMLDDNDTHLNIGPLSVCFWTRGDQKISGLFNSLLNKAHPEQVKEFLKAPFSGISDKEVLRKERLYTAAFKGNRGRIFVQYWLDQPLETAQENFAQWWNHLQITSLYKKTDKTPPPYAIPVLAKTTLRRTKDHGDDKLLGERIICLYRAALEKGTLPITLLKPILDEFHSALVKDDEKKPLYPFSTSRFALIKLILLRNPNRKEDDFMPTYELADTPDPAYNLGRLLAVLDSLQKRSLTANKDQGTKKPTLNAGVIQRYYGRASTAPAQIFPLLLSLSMHHFSKLAKGNDRDKKASTSFEKKKEDILAKFRANPTEAPNFPRLLRLEEQGRFALGFYQQKAFDREQYRKWLETKGKEGGEVFADDDENAE